jgi:PAS domain S-box-containing protein/putative nucleotidyltransferase with HDIG domain
MRFNVTQRGIGMTEKKTETLYHTIFEHAVEGIYLVTPGGEFIAANPAFALIFGYESPEELATDISNPWAQLYCEPEQREKLYRILMKKDIVTGFESQAYRKDGSMIMISESVRAVRDKNGGVIYFRGSVVDITLRKHNAEACLENVTHLRLLLEQAERNKDILLGIIDEVCVSHRTMENIFTTLVRDMVNALDSRRWWTRERSQRIASYALTIAEDMGFHEDEKRMVHFGALLHDIGQSVFYDELVDKPVKLSRDEVELIRKHPEQGAAVLNKAKGLQDVMPFIRHHHERVDGKGYPNGLKGDEIPMGARIIHVATAYDSITTDRPYRPAQGKEYALREIVRCTNSQFDPKVTEVALKVL